MKISYSKKETKNLGNYENVVIEIRAEDDVNWEKESQNECFERLREFVNTKLIDSFELRKPKIQLNDKNHILQQDIQQNDQKTWIDIKVLATKCVELIRIDSDNRKIIKDILSKDYNVTKISELRRNDLMSFYEFIDAISKNYRRN